MPLQHLNQMELFTFEDSSSEESMDSYTGSWLSTPRRRFGQPLSNRSLVQNVMSRPQDQQQPLIMFGRMTPPSQELGLNLEQNPSIEAQIRIGKPLEVVPNQVTLTQSQPMYMLDVITNSEGSGQIILDLLQLNEKYLCSGVSLAVASLEGPGQRQVWTHSLKIQTASSGMGTVVKSMLLLMNFVELSTFHICSDGSTDIQLSLKLKEARLYLEQRRSGLLPISILESGTMTWIPLPQMLSLEDSPSPTFRSVTRRRITPTPVNFQEDRWNPYLGYDNL